MVGRVLAIAGRGLAIAGSSQILFVCGSMMQYESYGPRTASEYVKGAPRPNEGMTILSPPVGVFDCIAEAAISIGMT